MGDTPPLPPAAQESRGTPDDSRPLSSPQRLSIDQGGGCVETSRPTTHSHPTYIVDDVVHYCATNMPGAVGRTSTYALTNVTLPYVLQLARKGLDRAIAKNAALRQGVNIHHGQATNPAVAATFGLECAPA